LTLETHSAAPVLPKSTAFMRQQGRIYHETACLSDRLLEKADFGTATMTKNYPN